MGRIDDALRRSGTETRGTSAAIPRIDGDQFRNVPWTFAELPEALDTETTAPVPFVDIDPVIMDPPEEAEPVQAVPHNGRLLQEPGIHALHELGEKWTGRLAISPGVTPALVEQFRRLAATLFRAQSAGALKVMMVTSALPGEGKTLTSVNLALILSESYRRRVLLIDADLRRPSINEISRLVPTGGLSAGLKATVEQKLSVFQVTENLTILPAGAPDPDPMSGLTSPRMRQILEEASARFDWVILDAPPVGPVADAGLLSQMVDASLMVVRAGVTPFAAVQKAVDAIGRDRIFGVVLNGVDQVHQDGYEASYAAYQVPGA